MKITSYRYPGEQSTLATTLLLIILLTGLASAVSICVAPLLFAALALISYSLNRSHHQQLIRRGFRVNRAEQPSLAALVQDCVNRLRPESVDVFVVPGRELNAYTFGIDNPKVVVLFGSLLKYMDAGELRFIIGHELGHVALGHTWLNSLVGGMAGVPASLGAAVIITLAFRRWNRVCEYSADRAGLLACGNLNKAISALVKLVNRQADTAEEIKETLEIIEREDDALDNLLLETLATHPMIVKRIENLRRFANSEEYRRLQEQINRV